MNRNLATTLPSRRRWLAATTALAGFLTLGTAAHALPAGGSVSAGGASIGAGAGSLTVNQTTQNAAINWQSFDIGSGESVVFVQPNSSSVALNRVLGPDGTTILGNLSANGKVFIVNPNGVLFGAGSQVNVAGLVASTRNISDADFMNANYRFSGSGGGAVLNQGHINADGGYVALLGASVTNDGVIAAKLGTVALAAGNAVTLDVVGNGLLNVTINEGAVNALVANGGMISAGGGQVVLTAQAAGTLLKTVVNNTGVIEARSLENRNGSIRLLGDMQSGTVSMSGTLDASGANAGESGGTVMLLAHNVGLSGSINASGNAGGGFVETSGTHVAIAPTARVNTLAANGAGGMWLLDPDFYEIAISGGDETPDQVTTSLASSNRIIQADFDITVTNSITWGTGTTLTLDAGRDVIIVSGADIVASAGNAGFVVLAGRDVTTGGAITASGTNSIIDISAGGVLTVNGAMTASALNNQIVLTSGGNLVTNGDITASQVGTNIEMYAGDNLDIHGAVTASGSGALIDLNADGNITQHVGSAITASGGGAIVMRADADGSGGITGGTVDLDAPAGVTSGSVTIYYSPENGYALPNSYVGVGNVTSYMWAFADAQDKQYDGNTDAVLTFASFATYGDPTVGGTRDVQMAAAGGTFDDKNVGVDKVVTPNGAAALEGADADMYALYDGPNAMKASITPAPLTITANDVHKTYGQAVTLPGTAFTSSALVAGETIGSVTEVSAGTVASATVAGSPYAITPSAATGGSFTPTNYTITYIDGALFVAPKALTVAVNDFSKSYGQVLTFTGSEFTATGLENGDTIAGVTVESDGAGATAGVVGGPYAVTGSDAVGGSYVASNYDTTYVDGELTVTPAVLVITPDDASKYYPTSIDFEGTEFTSVGLQNSETIGSVTLTSDGEGTTAVASSQPYMIIASDAGGGTFTPSNYAISYTTGELTVLAPTFITDGGSNSVGPTPTFPGPTSPGVFDGGDSIWGGGDSTEATAGDDSTEATAGDEGTWTGSTPISTPDGVDLAVQGEGVRMPDYQVAQAQPLDSRFTETQQQEQQQMAPAYTPEAPYVAPVVPRKQGRN